MTVFHAESSGNSAKLGKSQPFIKVPRMCIAFHDSIKLKHPEAQFPAYVQTIQHQFFTYMLSARIRCNGIAGIADMAATSHVVGVEDIQPQDSSILLGHAGIALGCKEGLACIHVQEFLLRKRNAFFNDFIPYAN